MAKNISLIYSKPDEAQKLEIEKYYLGERIPAEKKPYLTDLKNGIGPFLPTQKDRYILDGSSQIATMGLGFNPTSFFGVSHFYEAWLNDPSSVDFQNLRKSYEQFLVRKAGWEKGFVHFCHSGAEANEIALGTCYASRFSPSQKKVLAFEGSFHGRMMVTLSATYNPSKREPYEWPSFKSDYTDWPRLAFDHKSEGPVPERWKELWENAESPSFEVHAKHFESESEVLKEEVRCLKMLREKLKTGEHYAVILEPRQCEGGDRYGSRRFHNAVGILCHLYGVPYIYDEVQCGYGLSGEFFWHRLFENSNSRGECVGPQFVTCAKKAQLGVVVSRNKIPFPQEFATHSLIRGYIQAMVMDQSRERVYEIENYVRPLLRNFVKEFSEDIENPRMQGLSYSIDFKSKELCDKFIAKRFENGILFYPAGNSTARFRLNLGFRPGDITLLFKEMSQTLSQAKGSPAEYIKEAPSFEKNLEELWSFHTDEVVSMLDFKAPSKDSAIQTTLQFLESHSSVRKAGLRAEWIDSANFKKFESAILDLEKSTYEPARQTSSQEFNQAVSSEGGFGLALFKGQELVAICFNGNLNSFSTVRGVRRDPFFGSSKAYYALDLTVKKGYQGQDLGKALKMASFKAIKSLGGERIQGRNRDSLAGPMLSINLSMGAYELNHLIEDYPDNEKYRDCFYYTTRVRWEKPRIRLSSGVTAPLSALQLSKEFVDKYKGPLLTKICLSNFVSTDYLNNLKTFSDLLPESLRHSYTTSGQSECVDKLIKSLWTVRKHERLLTFEGQYFGAGSNMARSLSGYSASVFPVDRLKSPFDVSENETLQNLEKALKANSYHSVWIEPVGQKTMKAWGPELLKKVLEACRTHGVPVVFNDTASMFYRWSEKHFMASSDLVPDAGYCYLGGQMGVTFSRKELFVSKPLEIISTWDGDEYSLAQFSEALKFVEADKKSYFDLRAKFEKKLVDFVTENGARVAFLNRGVGVVEGGLNLKLQKYFMPLGECYRNKWAVIPSPGEMSRFVNQVSYD